MKYERTHALDDMIERLTTEEPLLQSLGAMDVKFAVLWFRDEGPLMCKGWPANAMIRKTSDKERALGLEDSVIIFDWTVWEELTDEQQVALVAHELYHIQLVEEGGHFEPDPADATKEVWKPLYMRDDAGRPKIAMRKHDIEVGWFLKIAERFGPHSMEVKQAKEIVDVHGQMLLFGEGTSGEKLTKAMQKLKTAIGKGGKIKVTHAGKTVGIDGEE